MPLADCSVIDGFDPLAEPDHENPDIKSILEQSRKRDVLNILRSYTGVFDALAEPTQNALDAVEKVVREGRRNYEPHIWITIDISKSTIEIVDNGCGLSLHEFLYCIRPNVSYKKRRESRGHKGVGLTFLAYGYSYFEMHTKRKSETYAAALRNGRQWVEDISGSVKKPVLERLEFDVPRLAMEESGTSIKILIGDNRDERPNLHWLGAENATQWLGILRLKTPVGGIYVKTPPFSPTYTITVKRANEPDSVLEERNVSYYFPHEFRVINKAESLSAIAAELARIPGDPQTKLTRLPARMKQLDCLFEVWDHDQILDEDHPFVADFSEEERTLAEQHQVSVYGCFLRSQTLWSDFQTEELTLRRNVKLIHGGLQLASDYMVQGDLSIIPLTHAAGYQHFAHVVIHYIDGNPDMGRKVFQPELKSLAEKLAVRVVNELRRYQHLLKPDTGASGVLPSRELHDWKRRQEEHFDRNPLSFLHAGRGISILSKPQEEQDVIALFHQLCGLGCFDGLQFFCSERTERYDGLYQLHYADESVYYDHETNPLGVSRELILPIASEPRVLEYKFSFEAFSRDVQRDIKHARDVQLVICWSAGSGFADQFYLQSLLVGNEGSLRHTVGATHRAFMSGVERVPVFELILVDDLLRFIENPIAEEARQKTLYRG